MKRIITIAFIALGSSLFTLCSGQYTDLINFSGTSGSYNGETPESTLTLAGHKLYGATAYGGAGGYGNLFSVDINGSGYTDLHDFTGGNDGKYIETTLTLVGKRLYGMASWGGANGGGDIFSIDTDGSNFTPIYAFPINQYPLYGPMAFYKDKLYGMTFQGGSNNTGVVFSFDTVTSTYTTLYSFGTGGYAGASPKGEIVISRGWLYGMTNAGGSIYKGNIFAIDTNGNNYRQILDLNNSTLNNPQEGDLVLSGKVLYGMGFAGGAHSDGGVFAVDTDGTHYHDLVDFDGTSSPYGSTPYGSLMLSGNTLYGMVYGGGIHDSGVIFSIDTSGTGYNNIHNFSGQTSNGAYPEGDLILSNGVLYGMTSQGGTQGYGVVFSDSICSLAAITGFTPSSCTNTGGSASVISINGGASPYTYLWSPGNQTNATASGLSAGNYTVTIANYGCSTTTSVTITQSASPITTTKYSGPDIAAVTPNGGATPYTYTWSPGGATTDTIKNATAGTYTCAITDKNGCTATAIIHVTRTGINSIANNTENISIYPNPSKGKFSISIMNNEQGIMNVEVYSMLGQQVYFNSIPIAIGINIQHSTFDIDLSSQPDGVYLYRVITQDGSLVGEGKLVIEK